MKYCQLSLTQSLAERNVHLGIMFLGHFISVYCVAVVGVLYD